MQQFKYQQLAKTLKSQIDENNWQINEKLPSIRVLANNFNVSKISVQKALYVLEAMDLIYVKPKSGYYVAARKNIQHINPEIQGISKPTKVDLPEVFYDIMERGAAFDIAPQHLNNSQTPSHLLLLNRHINRALRQTVHENSLYYSAPSGSLALRHQISKHYRKRRVDISADDICITSGCQNSIFLALTTICQAGDIVAIESPAFYGVLQLLQQLKLKVVELPSSYTQGVTAEALRAASKQWHIKACVITANFSTPTGALIPSLEKQAIVTVANEENITLIEDDIYGDLSFHSNVEPLKRYDMQDNVILCSSFSKSLSRDLRIGWIVTNKHYKKIAQMKLVYQLSSSQAIQHGLTSFLAEGHFERHLYQYRRTLVKQRDQLIKEVTNHWNIPVKFTVPEGGLAIWMELPKGVDTFSLYNKAIAEGIVITPGRLFTSADKFSNYFRLSFAHPTQGHRLKALIRLAELSKESY
ncbi:PLP-dependent aminotransferase family protein [Colwellia sp. 1_MG-2023]|uniref:aminotransferase-like domain-containing protein n=1 Tax=Colwellia sp. 1_MG-2023 TaxID=3062649 RepID=UPI0026E200A5|nr:PLP-dependent aminotransferase family protein [Colwellia sp. 1_MG-2023]MDO6447020.1 PLP-dependent aminotransferase family protein [Colwellia sp. 1_MG-2023]